MSYIAERRLEEKERRRVEILDAAEGVAAELGTEALTMELVARRARLSRALLYIYFKDKPDLLLGIAERALTLQCARFREAAARHTLGLDQLEAIAHSYVAFGQEFPVYLDVLDRFKVYARGSRETSDTTSACVLAAARVYDVIIQCIKAGVADGSVRPDAGDARVVSFVLHALTHGTMEVAATKATMLSYYDVGPKELVEHGVRMIRRSLAAEP